ncbi:MAG: hypothetical protein JOY72_02960 [Actinobacteria bacterium]|nr:hypothetical protein [Actinomycetota bacterium]MBV8479243.1 hypothetical protein [Actinomycetota bacterium]MBV8597582.1 hypothetical protein [Actinomycetota bacterium]
MSYRDPLLEIDAGELTIRRYYGVGSRRIPLDTIREAVERPLSFRFGSWRIWGSGDFRHWWNLDPSRPSKPERFELVTGRWVIPTVTPDDPAAFADALRAAGVAVRSA